MARPRKRSPEESLELCLQEFWRRCYEATSIADLCEALEVGPSSLYNAFGNKEQIYRQALEQYTERNSSFMKEALAIDDTALALCTVLERAVEAYLDASCPGGCAVLAASTQEVELNAFLKRQRGRTLSALERRIRRGIKAGDLRADTTAAERASFVFCLLQGLSQEARDGRKKASLRAAVRAAKPVILAKSVQGSRQKTRTPAGEPAG